MSQPRVCLQSQTPLVRFLRDPPQRANLDDLAEERDYLISPGGVTRMLRGLSQRLEKRGRIAPATWVSLAREPARLAWGKRWLDFIALPQEEMEEYATAKSLFWNELHGLEPTGDPDAISRGMGILGRAVAARSSALHDETPFDLFYTHDFQLLACGRELPAGVPRVFRWHGPMRRISAPMREYMARCLDDFDAVIVSTHEYARELRTWGVRTPIHASYPYLDESRRRVVTEADLVAFEERHGLRASDIAFVVVARMDPIKCHDVAIRALARIASKAPDATLVLVGGGGFSAGRRGLGLTHSADHRTSLEALASVLGVRDRLVFTGGVSDAELDVAITRARAVILPSALEGFGLAAVEGWLYGKPALVSRGAGVAEIVRDGENGYSFEPGDDVALGQAMLALAKDEDFARLMGAEGRRSARICHLDRGANDVWTILRAAMDGDHAWEHPARRRW